MAKQCTRVQDVAVQRPKIVVIVAVNVGLGFFITKSIHKQCNAALTLCLRAVSFVVVFFPFLSLFRYYHFVYIHLNFHAK